MEASYNLICDRQESTCRIFIKTTTYVNVGSAEF